LDTAAQVLTRALLQSEAGRQLANVVGSASKAITAANQIGSALKSLLAGGVSPVAFVGSVFGGLNLFGGAMQSSTQDPYGPLILDELRSIREQLNRIELKLEEIQLQLSEIRADLARTQRTLDLLRADVATVQRSLEEMAKRTDEDLKAIGSKVDSLAMREVTSK